MMLLFLLACVQATSAPDDAPSVPQDSAENSAALCPEPEIEVVEIPVYVQDLCNGIDDDGDGVIDEDGRVLWLSDPAQQGCGDALPAALACEQPYGMALPCDGMSWP
jgi:hypothetical protein